AHRRYPRCYLLACRRPFTGSLQAEQETAMLTIRDHGVDDYEQLADMDASDVGVLTDDDRDWIAELGDYLITSGGWERFAVWLLHKHFLPEPGEVFVERAISRPPQTHTTLIDRTAF